MVILHRLEDISVDKVLVDGRVVAEDGELCQQLPDFTYPQWSQKTMHIHKEITPADLTLSTSSKQTRVKTRIICAEVPKKVIVRKLKTKDGSVIPPIDEDILPIAVIERHKATGNIGKAFIKGTGIKQGTIATSVAHDAHNIVVVGTRFEDMALAVNRLAQMGGGIIAVRDGKILSEVALPIAGLISLKPAEVVAERVGKLEHIVINDLGCALRPNPFFQLAIITLPNVPNIGITDKGLFDVLKYRIIDNFAG
jgi:adenine deaminase